MEQMQKINRIFEYSLFQTKTDFFMLNVPILQLRLRSRHNPEIRDRTQYLAVAIYIAIKNCNKYCYNFKYYNNYFYEFKYCNKY